MPQGMRTQSSKGYFVTSGYLLEAENTRLSLFISLGIRGGGGGRVGKGVRKTVHVCPRSLSKQTRC